MPLFKINCEYDIFQILKSNKQFEERTTTEKINRQSLKSAVCSSFPSASDPMKCSFNSTL